MKLPHFLSTFSSLFSKPSLDSLSSSKLKENSYVLLHHRLLVIRLQGEIEILERQNFFLEERTRKASLPALPEAWGNLERPGP